MRATINSLDIDEHQLELIDNLGELEKSLEVQDASAQMMIFLV